jgi:hypothetical protein
VGEGETSSTRRIAPIATLSDSFSIRSSET